MTSLNLSAVFMTQTDYGGFLVSSWLVRAHDSIQQNVLASANLESSRTHRSQGDRHSPN